MIYWLIYILAEAFIQSKLIAKGWKPDYLQLFIIRGMISILHGALILDVHNTYEALIMWGWQMCSFWIVFDLSLNFLRKKPILYKGKRSGWLDKIAYPVYIPMKILAIAGAVFFYIKGLEFWIV